MGLGEWRGLQELLSRCSRRFIYVELIVLAAATYDVNHSRGDQCAVGYTSVSIAPARHLPASEVHQAVGEDEAGVQETEYQAKSG